MTGTYSKGKKFLSVLLLVTFMLTTVIAAPVLAQPPINPPITLQLKTHGDEDFSNVTSIKAEVYDVIDDNDVKVAEDIDLFPDKEDNPTKLVGTVVASKFIAPYTNITSEAKLSVTFFWLGGSTSTTGKITGSGPNSTWNFQDKDWVFPQKTFNVNFDENGGSSVIDQTNIPAGSLITNPGTPILEGYTFGGWFKDDDIFTNQWDFATDTMPASDLTLYAKWTINKYNVTFDENGGSAVSDQPNVEYGALVTDPGTTTYAGYTFGGWFTDDNTFANQWDFATDTMPAADLTLYAKWTSNGGGGPISYNVYFDENGGSAVSDQPNVEYGALVTDPGTTTYAGYTFGGWFTDDNTFANQWDFATDTMPAADLTLYAKWTSNGGGGPISYNVYFDENGGSAVADQTNVSAESLITDPGTTTYHGYTFGGWFTDDSTFTDQWDFATDKMPASDLTLYAKWTINKYNVTFDENGGSAVSDQPNVEYGALVTDPGTTTYAGYTFGGWFTDDSTFTDQWDFATDKMPASDLTLYAKWTINKYNVTFDENGGSAVSDQPNVEYGALVTDPGTTTYAGYTFGGWFTDDNTFANQWDFSTDTMPAADLTLYAKWTSTGSSGNGNNNNNNNNNNDEPTPEVIIEETPAPEAPIVITPAPEEVPEEIIIVDEDKPLGELPKTGTGPMCPAPSQAAAYLPEELVLNFKDEDEDEIA